ncbi:MAG: tetratricopeptide repeat protein [Pleurocapsa sp.]
MQHKRTIKLIFFAFTLASYSYPLLSEPNQTSDIEVLQNTKNPEQIIDEQDLLNAAIYSNRGSVGISQKQWNTALKDLNRAIELDPNFARAYMNRGLLYSILKRWDDALKNFNRAIELYPKYFPTYIYRGYIYGFKQEFESAIRDLNQAVSLNEQNATAYYVRATVY